MGATPILFSFELCSLFCSSSNCISLLSSFTLVFFPIKYSTFYTIKSIQNASVFRFFQELHLSPFPANSFLYKSEFFVQVTLVAYATNNRNGMIKNLVKKIIPYIKFFEVIHIIHKQTFVYSFIKLYFPHFLCGKLKKRTFVPFFFINFFRFFDIFLLIFIISDKLSTDLFHLFLPFLLKCG